MSKSNKWHRVTEDKWFLNIQVYLLVYIYKVYIYQWLIVAFSKLFGALYVKKYSEGSIGGYLASLITCTEHRKHQIVR